MNRRIAVITLSSLMVGAFFANVASADPKSDKKAAKQKSKKDDKKAEKGSKDDMPALSFIVKDIDGKDQDLRQYAGKVVLMVNTASKCGYTPQYKGLQALYEKYKDKGFVILAFPANDFGKQEPGTNEEIKSFCTGKYNVGFPIFDKVQVKGPEICPLYKYLTKKKSGHPYAGDIPWNFTKFLIDRDGQIIGRYDPRTTPEDETLVKTIEKALADDKAGNGKHKP